MDYTELDSKDRVEYQEQLLIDAHQKYVDWWLPIDVAGGSFMAPMSLLSFCEYLLVFEDEEWFGKWLNEDDLVMPKSGGVRSAKIGMKKLILQRVIGHYAGWVDLHIKENPFKWIKEETEKQELR